MPRVPLPDVGITVIREPCHRLFRGHYSPFLAPTDSFANPRWLSFPSVFRLVEGVFAGCYQPRLRTRIFPTLFLRICPVLPEPVPRRVPWSAFAWFFLHVFGLPKKENWSASRLFPRTRFSAGLLSRLQLFRYVQGRGRDSGCPLPPAQSRAGAVSAHGSYLGCLASKRTLG